MQDVPGPILYTLKDLSPDSEAITESIWVSAVWAIL